MSRQLTKQQQDLAAENIRLTTELIKRNIGRNQLTYDEIYDASIEALISASFHFKQELGFKFSTLFFITGDKAIKTKLRNKKAKKRNGKTISIYEENGAINMLEHHDTYSFFDKKELSQAFMNCGLKTSELSCIYLYYFERMSQSKTAKELGISQPHVGRLLDKGISKLRNYILERL